MRHRHNTSAPLLRPLRAPPRDPQFPWARPARVNSEPRLRPGDGPGLSGVHSIEPGPDLGGPRGLRTGLGFEDSESARRREQHVLQRKPKRLDQQNVWSPCFKAITGIPDPAFALAGSGSPQLDDGPLDPNVCHAALTGCGSSRSSCSRHLVWPGRPPDGQRVPQSKVPRAEPAFDHRPPVAPFEVWRSSARPRRRFPRTSVRLIRRSSGAQWPACATG
jgi:hypothetical protein